MSASGHREAVVFDFDGTLFTLPVSWGRVREDVSKATGADLEGKPLFATLDEIIKSGSYPRKELYAIVDSYEVEAAESAAPVGGALDLLAEASNVSRLALVTMQGRAACRRVLERFGAAPFFSAVLTREDSLSRESQVVSACRALGSEPSSALLVGDRKSDLDAGRACGATVALVGAVAKEEWGADYLFRTLAELKQVI